jgi:hypothetical protein
MAARVTSPPAVYAYDFDPRLGGPSRFHELTGGGYGRLKNYAVSDHRPVHLSLRA